MRLGARGCAEAGQGRTCFILLSNSGGHPHLHSNRFLSTQNLPSPSTSPLTSSYSPSRTSFLFPARNPFQSPCTRTSRRSYALPRGLKVEMELVNNQAVVVRTSPEPVLLEDGCAFYTHTVEPIHSPPPPPKAKVILTDEQIQEMRGLRESDPARWTQRTLAQHFGVETYQVAEAAPAAEEWLKKLQNDKEIERLKDIFERGVSPYRKRTNSSLRLPAMKLRNAEMFAGMVKEAGGLKKFLRNNNLVEKRLKRGKKPPPFKVIEEHTEGSDDWDDFDAKTFNPKEFMDIKPVYTDLGRKKEWEKKQQELSKRLQTRTVRPAAASSSTKGRTPTKYS